MRLNHSVLCFVLACGFDSGGLTTSGSATNPSSASESSGTDGSSTGSSTEPDGTETSIVPTTNPDEGSGSGDVPSSDTNTDSSDTDPTTGGQVCYELTCEDYPPREGECEDEDAPAPLGAMLAEFIAGLDEAMLACCEDTSTIEAQALCIGLIKPGTDVKAPATTCQEEALLDLLPTLKPHQKVTMGGKDQSIKGGSPVKFTTAEFCGVSEQFPAPPLIMSLQIGPCNPDEDGDPNTDALVNSVQISFLDPDTQQIVPFALELVDGEAEVSNTLFYGVDGHLKPFDLLVEPHLPEKTIELCASYRATDDDLKTEIAGMAPLIEVTP